jgi:hypothetical protein
MYEDVHCTDLVHNGVHRLSSIYTVLNFIFSHKQEISCLVEKRAF